MYIQTLQTTLAPTQADYAKVNETFSNLKSTTSSGSMTGNISRMLDNLDTLAGRGASTTLLDGFGVKRGDIASLDPDTRTRLNEKVTNRYLSAIKEAAGDTSGGFADVYGNMTGDGTSAAHDVSAPQAEAGVPSQEVTGPTMSPAQDPDVLADILMRSIAYKPVR